MELKVVQLFFIANYAAGKKPMFYEINTAAYI